MANQKETISTQIQEKEIKTSKPVLKAENIALKLLNQNPSLKNVSFLTNKQTNFEYVKGLFEKKEAVTEKPVIKAEEVAFEVKETLKDEAISDNKSIIYFHRKPKNFFFSLLTYLRDIIVFFSPIQKLPPFIRKILYGNIDYVFFIHPRRIEDYYLGLPFLFLLKKILPANFFSFFTNKIAPIVVCSIINNKKKGVVISSPMLPEFLFKDRKKALESAIKSIYFCNKISKEKCIVGLGGWWPIVSHRGIALQSKITNDTIITSGHMGTLLSIYLMIEKIANISNISLNELKIIILGAGKMGGNVASILSNKVDLISFYDINHKNIENTITQIRKNIHSNNTKIQSFTKDDMRLFDILNQHHLGICVTSNIDIVVDAKEIPDYFIFIDDSRPEAITRKYNQGKKIVLEGGLMKIKNAKINYDFGFGIDENVFGCLAETYALSLNEKNIISNSLGDIDLDKFEITKNFFNQNEIKVGDFKTGDKIINKDKIILFLNERSKMLKKLEVVQCH